MRARLDTRALASRVASGGPDHSTGIGITLKRTDYEQGHYDPDPIYNRLSDYTATYEGKVSLTNYAPDRVTSRSNTTASQTVKRTSKTFFVVGNQIQEPPPNPNPQEWPFP